MKREARRLVLRAMFFCPKPNKMVERGQSQGRPFFICCAGATRFKTLEIMDVHDQVIKEIKDGFSGSPLRDPN